MPRKEKQYHFLYKTTNLINSKFYCGMHSTDDLNDGYLGSGLRLRRSIQKYGKENFKLEIIKFYLNRIELIEAEKNLVNESLLQDPFCMNLMKGGEGGFISVEQQAYRSSCGGKKNAYLIKTDGEYAQQLKDKISKAIKNVHKQCKYDYTIIKNAFKGKHHTDETKNKIGNANSIKQKGEKNSQYGTCCIYNEETKKNKRIKKEELETYLNNGWLKGFFTSDETKLKISKTLKDTNKLKH